jgi:hypothetical protein
MKAPSSCFFLANARTTSGGEAVSAAAGTADSGRERRCAKKKTHKLEKILQKKRIRHCGPRGAQGAAETLNKKICRFKIRLFKKQILFHRGGQAVSAAAGEDSGHAQGAEEQNDIFF